MRGTLGRNICTRTAGPGVRKLLCPPLPHLEPRVARALRRLLPGRAHAQPSDGTEPVPPPTPAAPRDSLLGRAPQRGQRLPAGRRLPNLPRCGSDGARRRGPRLPRQLLGTAPAGPRSRLGHGPPTHRAADNGGGAAGGQRLRATGSPSRWGARPWPPPIYCPPASDGAQGASGRVTATRPAASDPHQGGAAREGGDGGRVSRDAEPAHAPARAELPAWRRHTRRGHARCMLRPLEPSLCCRACGELSLSWTLSLMSQAAQGVRGGKGQGA